MHRNPINFLYNPDHATLSCVEVGSVTNAGEGSMQEHHWARVARVNVGQIKVKDWMG